MNQPIRTNGFLIPLRQGETALVRPILPSDKSILNAAYKMLSDESKYTRFLTLMRQLNSYQLAYLTEVDQINHVAWGIGLPHRPDIPGIAIGRSVRIKEEPDTVEIAITVLDEFQSQGVGTFLLALLYRVAQHQGDVRQLRGVIGTSNSRTIKWMRAVGAALYLSPDGMMHADIPVTHGLPNVPKTRAAHRFRRVLELIQQGEVNQTCPALKKSRTR